MKPFESRRMAGIEKTLIRRMADLADSSCLNLGLGEPGFPTPRAIVEHVRQNLGRWPLGYTPNEGYAELRELIASKNPSRASAGQVCVTVGAQEALFAVLMILVETGDEVLVPDPGFPAYASIVRIAGGKPRTYALRAESGFGLDVEAVEKSLSQATRALIVNSPNNPAGAVYDPEAIRRLAAACDRQGIWLISDEVYAAIHYGIQPASPAPWAERCIVVNSLSKTFCLTGWRIGWCVVPLEFMKPLAAFHQLSATCAPAVSQHAAIFALRGGAEAEREDNLRELSARRRLAMDALWRCGGVPFVVPAGAFYLMADVRRWIGRFGDSLTLAREFLAREKVVTIPGSAFGPSGEGFLRLSFAARREEIEEGISRLGRFLGE
jgi:aspartate/methionine/tyrosine aminotransferase